MKYYLYITGCDMNRSDAERVASVFNKHGFSLASNEGEADVIIAFACSVREKAVHKILGKVNQWAKMKNPKSQIPMTNQISNPKKLKSYKLPAIMVTGCLLPKDKRKMAEKVDLVFGMEEIEKLEEFLNSIKYKVLSIKQESKNHNTKYIIHNTNTNLEKGNDYLSIKPQYQSKYSVYVPIMTGCDNFCTYCAVPYTRGREVSRSEAEVLEEVQNLVKRGYKEITLLGQNVNSYKFGFVQLLEKIDEIKCSPSTTLGTKSLEQTFWVRFYSNHPKDMSDELIEFLAQSKHFCHYIHLPLQSGDDRILKKMNRHYTAKQYLELVEKIKKKIPACAGRPDVTLTTDIIVGFPGETEKAFQNTVKVLEKTGFDMIFISEYSPRSGTPAAKMEDDVPHEEKERRKKFLNDEVLAKSVLKNNKKLVGKTVRVFVHREDKKGFFIGRTSGLKDVRITVGARRLNLRKETKVQPSFGIGEFVNIKITKANSWGMEGIVVIK